MRQKSREEENRVCREEKMQILRRKINVEQNVLCREGERREGEARERIGGCVKESMIE